jgi:hypothetical protein
MSFVKAACPAPATNELSFAISGKACEFKTNNHTSVGNPHSG